MLIKLYASLVALLFVPQTQVVSVKEANAVLSTSVLMRVKAQAKNEKGETVKGLVGCSGTFISGNRVLTAAHCFQGLDILNIWVRSSDFKISYRASILKLDGDHDLALLHIHGVSGHPYAKLAQSVRVGEKVINVGSPLMFEFLVSEGIVARLGYKAKGFASKYTITTAMINSGSSGGGAFNSKGELIGVNTMSVGFFGWTGISMAVSDKDIREFLKGTYGNL